jgi:response regulator NasT
MDGRGPRPLRVLIANERDDKLAVVVPLVASLGHEPIVRELDVDQVAAVTHHENPDVALVGLDGSSGRALEVIDRLVEEAVCPAIVILHEPDGEFVKEAARRGVFACIADDEAQELEGAIEIALGRFAEYHGLKGAFGRRAVIERAKGVLMERHSIDEATAFELLRDQARKTNRRLIDIAGAVLEAHGLLPERRGEE